ncbi:MAG: hypothetical protein HY922_15880 [Elusimicrobia bacterium]|nr:hypothetical protein [Elusimicrobiota bacterium]
MFTRDDLIDAILRRLRESSPASGERPAPARAALPSAPPPDADIARVRERTSQAPQPPRFLKGRRFLTEHEIKKALTPGARVLTIPTGAIVSPLAQEWLALKGIEIVRSDA